MSIIKVINGQHTCLYRVSVEDATIVFVIFFLLGASRIVITSVWKRDTAAIIYSLSAFKKGQYLQLQEMWGKQLRRCCCLLSLRGDGACSA